MISNKWTQTSGIAGMSGAVLFFIALLIEYRYGLFPPGNGALYVANQLMFFVAMTGILIMLVGMRQSRAGGDGILARVSLTLFPIGWAAIILGGIMNLFTYNEDIPLIPLGALTMLLFGLLSGIEVARSGPWQGWTRRAPLLQGLYYLLVMMILPPLLTGSNEPTLLTESAWMATWFLMGMALFQNGAMKVATKPAA